MWNFIVNTVNKIDEAFFDLDLSKFEYLKSTNKLNSIPKIVFFAGIGLMVAIIIAFYHQRILGSLVRTLISVEAIDEKSAIKLENVKGKAILLRALQKDASLKKYVKTVPKKDEKGNEYPENVDERRYYIDPALRSEAEKRYNGKGTGIAYLVLSLAVTFAVTVLLVSFRYEIAGAVNFLVGLTK